MTGLDIVRGELDRVNGEIRALNETAEKESRAALTDAEATTYATLRAERETLEAREAELVAEEKRAADVAATRAKLTPAGDGVTKEPATYVRTTDPSRSFMRDFLSAGKGDRDAMDRLYRNNAQVSDFYKRAGVTTSAGAGGQFDPPLWAVESYVALPRAGREFANTLNNQVLPGGVSSINLPTISAGTSVAAQSTQNTAVSNTDPTTSSVAISISTIAGYNLLSQQSIDQSPINLDDVIMADLVRAYDGALDTAAITAVAGTSGIIAQTYTDASPTTAKVNNQVLDAVQKVQTQRFAAPNVIVMHPKRWANFLGYLDGQGRPLVVPVGAGQNAAFNSIGQDVNNNAQGLVGYLWGLPVVVSPSIPTNLGTGTNQDEIFVMKSDDIVLYESAPRMDTQTAPYANQLSVLVRFWRYYGLGVRTTKSVALVSGTGLATLAIGS